MGVQLGDKLRALTHLYGRRCKIFGLDLAHTATSRYLASLQIRARMYLGGTWQAMEKQGANNKLFCNDLVC